MNYYRLQINVTPSDIANAKRGNAHGCAVVQALKRMLPHSRNQDVDRQSIRVTAEGKRLVYLTPRAVMRYLRQFDAGVKPGPFSFELRNPQMRPLRKRRQRESTLVVGVGVARRSPSPTSVSVTADVFPGGRKLVQRGYKTKKRIFGERVWTDDN